MRRKASRCLALVLILLLFAPAILSGQNPLPPSQPASGPGGKQYLHTAVNKNRYGKGGQEYWIFEPDAPKPAAAAPVICFCMAGAG